MSGRGLLLVVAILALFFAIFVPIARRVGQGRDASIDADRLRHTYVAVALYENEHDGADPPNLNSVRRDVEPIDLQSIGDSFVKEPTRVSRDTLLGNYPLDPALPNLPLFSRSRVSWSYRYDWPESRGTKANDPRQGLLADWWIGPVLTVTMDGAILQRPSGALNFKDLFGR